VTWTRQHRHHQLIPSPQSPWPSPPETPSCTPDATSRERVTQHLRYRKYKKCIWKDHTVFRSFVHPADLECGNGEKCSFTKPRSGGAFYKMTGHYAKERKQPKATCREKAI